MVNRQRIGTASRWFVIAAVVVAAAVAVAGNRHDVAASLAAVGAIRFAAATAVAVLAIALLCASWRTLLPEGGRSVPAAEAYAVFSSSQLGKYLPGSVWPLVAQMSLTRRGRVTRGSVAVAFSVNLVVLVVAAVTVAVVLLGLGDAAALQERWWLLLVVLALCTLVHPAVLRRLLAAAARVVRRPLDAQIPSGGQLVTSAVWAAGAFVAFGVNLALLAAPLSHASVGRLGMQCTGGFALAWATGFVIVLAPAGLGIREVVLSVALASLTDETTALALMSRVSLVLADVIAGLAGLAILASRGLLRRPAGRAPLAEGLRVDHD
jgi:hypothetical protein